MRKLRFMRYDEQALRDIAQKYLEINGIRDQLIRRLVTAQAALRQARAKEYLLHGVARRLGILTRCVHNVFTIFPIERTERLELDALTDLDINLHAFFVNISGLFDNVGWAFAIENNLVGTSKEGKLERHDIGIFNRKTQVHFPDKLRTYLNSQQILNWYSTYSKNYRDALAHRIPMYVPPFVLNEEEQTRYLALEEQLKNWMFVIPSIFSFTINL